TRVVLYDDTMSRDAARVWWILRYWGVKDARLLNGGWPAWTAGNHPISKDPPAIPVAVFPIDTQDKRFATKEFLLGKLKDYQIVDTRSEAEYCGDDKLKNKRGGAIPGAMHLEWAQALDKKTQRFKSASDLAKLLKDAG